jgi:hypothetical protein
MLRPALLLLVVASACAARADGIAKDRERAIVDERVEFARPIDPCGRPFTRTNCTPDYVGSEMGLAKPSYYGTRIPHDGLPVPRW